MIVKTFLTNIKESLKGRAFLYILTIGNWIVADLGKIVVQRHLIISVVLWRTRFNSLTTAYESTQK